MGTPDFSVPCLQTLIDDGHDVCAVFTQPDKPKGRHGVLTPPPVKELALKYDIPVYQPKTLKTDEAKELFKSLNAELAIVVAYGKILPGEFIHAPKYGCINMHASLLPKLRGAAPIQWSIITAEIFSQYGEKRFRELEAQAVRSAAKEKGLIIATGGGAVLDPENVRALKGNGRIYYLKRDLDLLSLDGRPLSKSRETLDKMFEARDPIYSNCADAAINNDLSPVLTAQRIKDELGSSDI